jgi:hypothetical protein
MNDIPPEVKAFINTHIESIDQLRILLLLQSGAQSDWDVSDVSGKLYLRSDVVAAELASLEARGFCVSSGDPRRYRYQPKSADLKKKLEQVVQLDQERPVTLITLIYSRPKDIQAFADAFKLRPDKEK